MDINLSEAMEEYARLPFEPLHTFLYKTPAGHIQDGYTTNSSAFLFPVRGKAQYALSESTYEFKPGKVIHGCPGKWLSAHNEGNLPVEWFILYYHYDGNNAGYMHCPYEMEIGVNPRLLSILQQLVKLWGTSNAPALQTKTLVYSALSEMFSSAQGIQQMGANGIVEDAKAYVEQHYMEPHSLCELGGRYGMCGKYFSDVFKKHTGISPIEYLINYRMQQAQTLMVSTEYSLMEIGKTIGYEDVHYFRRQFKRKFGLSPAEWREHAQAANANRK